MEKTKSNFVYRFTQMLPMGIILGLCGFIIAYVIWTYNIGNLSAQLFVPATLAGFVTGSFFWWLIVSRKKKFTLTRGFWTGILIGIMVHPVMWYFDIIRGNLCYYVYHGASCAACPAPMTLLEGLTRGIVLYSYVSFYYWGWITIPACAILGVIVAKGSSLE